MSKLRAYTESGTCHEVDRETLTYQRLQLPVDASPESVRLDLRRDGEVLQLLEPPLPPVIGEPWTLVIEPLNTAARHTIRTTTFVVDVVELD